MWNPSYLKHREWLPFSWPNPDWYFSLLENESFNYKAKDYIKLSDFLCAIKKVIVPEANLRGPLNRWDLSIKFRKRNNRSFFFFLLAEPAHSFSSSSHLHKTSLSCYSRVIKIFCSKFISEYLNLLLTSNSRLVKIYAPFKIKLFSSTAQAPIERKSL